METAKKLEVTARMYKPEDYTQLQGWWTAQKWTPVPADMLPDLGIIMTVDGQDVCAGFLYTSNSKTVWMEWVIANPQTDKAVRSYALDNLIDNLITMAQLKGTKYIVTSVLHPKLIERLEEKGFIKAESTMTNMVKRMV